MCICVYVCVFLHDNSKSNRFRTMKFVVHENISVTLDNGHCMIKVKVMVGPVTQLWYNLGIL